jgi:hypothetical protein
MEVARRDEHVLRVRAVHVFAEDLEAHAHRVLARQAEAAAPTEQTRVDQHRLPDLDPLRLGSELGDDACSVGSEDPGLGHRRKAPTEPDIEVVERGRAHPYDRGASVRLGWVDVLEAQDLRAAVFVYSHRSHRGGC